MSVLKNDVGRPSNKTIMIRTILKVIGLLIVVGLAFGIGYYFNNQDKVQENSRKNAKTKAENKENLTEEEIKELTESYLITEYVELKQTVDEYMNSDLYKTMIALSNTSGQAYDLCSSYNDKVVCKNNKVILNDGSTGNSSAIVISNNDAKKTIKKMFKNYKYLDDVSTIQSAFATTKFNLDSGYGYQKITNYGSTFRSVPYNIQRVIGATKENNTIHVEYAFAEVKTDNNKDYYIIGKNNEKIDFDYVDYYDERGDNMQEILDKNIDKMIHYDIIFEKTDYGYVYSKIIKK